MGWEVVKGGRSGIGESLTNEEVSILEVKNGKTLQLRMNVNRDVFPKGVRNTVVKIDKEKRRIGFFVTGPDEEFNAKPLGRYGKRNEKLVYITLPRDKAVEMGFTKGRYEITPAKENTGIYFIIKAESKKIPKPKEEVKA